MPWKPAGVVAFTWIRTPGGRRRPTLKDLSLFVSLIKFENFFVQSNELVFGSSLLLTPKPGCYHPRVGLLNLQRACLQSVPVFLSKYTGKNSVERTNEPLPLQKKLTLGRILGGIIILNCCGAREREEERERERERDSQSQSLADRSILLFEI